MLHLKSYSNLILLITLLMILLSCQSESQTKAESAESQPKIETSEILWDTWAFLIFMRPMKLIFII